MQDFIASVYWMHWDGPDGVSVYPNDNKPAENTIIPNLSTCQFDPEEGEAVKMLPITFRMYYQIVSEQDEQK